MNYEIKLLYEAVLKDIQEDALEICEVLKESLESVTISHVKATYFVNESIMISMFYCCIFKLIE
jgi:hypothetical protein